MRDVTPKGTARFNADVFATVCDMNAKTLAHEKREHSEENPTGFERAACKTAAASKPSLEVCGHIHASGGKQAKMGATTVINAGPGGLIFEI